ncbi:MAG: DUF7424 family protein [Fervidobacterium sp.]|uniref:DUF7424 family protein n=1 Tax=Fervidobacterium sp. TaxID=1871331 RepID=UPI00404A993A
MWPEIYVSDMYDYATGQSKTFSAFATLRIEVGSSDSFNKYAEQVTGLLKKYFETVENVRYDEEDSFYVADIEITTDTSKLLSLSVSKDGTLSLNFNREKFKAINEEAEDISFYSVGEDEIFFMINLTNDLKKEVQLEPKSAVYINDKPFPFLEKTPMRARSKVTIVPSDV